MSSTLFTYYVLLGFVILIDVCVLGMLIYGIVRKNEPLIVIAIVTLFGAVIATLLVGTSKINWIMKHKPTCVVEDINTIHSYTDKYNKQKAISCLESHIEWKEDSISVAKYILKADREQSKILDSLYRKYSKMK